MLQFGEREWRVVYTAALRVLRAPDQAEDVAQEAMLRAWRARRSYDGRARPESWLWRIAHNAAISYARAERVHVSIDALRDGDAVSDPRPAPDSAALSRQQLRALDACLHAMNRRNRAAFIAADVLGATTRELGALLGVSPNAAKQRLFRARRDVRARMTALAG